MVRDYLLYVLQGLDRLSHPDYPLIHQCSRGRVRGQRVPFIPRIYNALTRSVILGVFGGCPFEFGRRMGIGGIVGFMLLFHRVSTCCQPFGRMIVQLPWYQGFSMTYCSVPMNIELVKASSVSFRKFSGYPYDKSISIPYNHRPLDGMLTICSPRVRGGGLERVQAGRRRLKWCLRDSSRSKHPMVYFRNGCMHKGVWWSVSTCGKRNVWWF